MRNNTKAKTTSLVVLLVSVFLLSAFAGVQFVGKVSAVTYTEYTGTLGNATFAVRIPDPWNGGLVVCCRGYAGATSIPNPVSTLGAANISALLDQGFAVTASNYGAAGFCIQKGMNSTYELTKYVVDTYHVRGKVFLYGLSMGGAVALLLGEKYPNVYSGVLDLFGTKDLKDQYNTKSRWANLSDAELTAELTALTVPIPIYMFGSVQSLRSFVAANVPDYIIETGGTPATQPKAYEDDSPTYHANISIPVITVQGTSDAIVPFYETLMYKTAVANAGRSNLYRLYNVTGGQHADPIVYAQVPTRFAELAAWSNALDAWTLTVDGRSMKAYPDLKEYVWQKNATMPPNGQYDKIGLHRLVKTGITPKGVVFLTNCPTWGTGETRISNPPTDNWTKYENASQAIYWANRGFDVYAIDYRSHFVPKTLNASQLSFAADWGLDVWVSDIKEAAEKVKQVSGSAKFFISGECTGGMAALNYAAKYWKTDLNGIILLDANFFTIAYPIVGRINETNTYNLTAAINDMNAMGTWNYDPYGSYRPAAAYALQNPGAPAEYPPGTPLAPLTNPVTNRTWANITEYFTYIANSAALMGTSGDINQVLYCIANSEFLPRRINIESPAMANWVNCPALTYDYNDHYNEIGVPVLAFDTGLFSNRTGTLRFVNGVNSIVTGIMLPTYGHLDVYVGTNSARDVSQPALDWMRGQLAGLGATAFGNVTVMPGWTWWFFAHSCGGTGSCTYQWYEGTTLLQGQTSMVLSVTKNVPGTYTFYCKVTDSAGETTNSNAVTLTVIG